MGLQNLPAVSIVIIGRNEASNLPACIRSVQEMDYPQDQLEVLYVDTDSMDRSPDIARSIGIIVYEEHSNFPSPGRARNRGWREAKYNIVHFVDGDMTVDPDYLRHAVQVLGKDGVVGVIGRLKECYADRNLIAHILEYPWIVRELGFVDAPGAGGTLLRAALEEIGGYNPELLRGEETDLGYRLRQRGHKILLIGQTMGVHDYQVRNPVDLWRYYQTRGYNFACILRLLPLRSIVAEQRSARRARIQVIIAITITLCLLFSGLWWVVLFLPILLAVYISIRYWKPKKLRGLRIAYFMLDYFLKPAVWVGMLRFYITKKGM